MNTAVAPIGNSPQSASPFNIAIVSGKLLSVRKFPTEDGPRYAHRVALPVVDEYSKASTVEFTGTDKLGEVGTVIRQKCGLTGWVRRFKTQDGDKGERCELRLTAIEG